MTELLTLWRATREPRVADVLEALGKRMPMPALPSTKKPDLKNWFAWARERTIEDLPALLAALDEISSSGRLAELDRWDPDPRVGRFVVSLSERFRAWSNHSTEVATHRGLFALIAKHADAEIVDRFDKLARRRLEDTGYITTSPWYDAESAAVAAQLRATVRKSDPAVRERCEGWLAALRPKPANRREELFAAVYAAPDDDGPRAVLADLLQAEGDPHGELIALQLAPPTPATAKRIKTLLRKPAALCAPALWKMLWGKSVRFERGFIAAGRLSPHPEAAWKTGIGAVEWATVHTLDLGSFAGWCRSSADLTRMLTFVHDPAMRHLRSVGPINIDEAAGLIEHGVPLPWRTLSIETANQREAQIEKLAGGRAVFPALQHLTLEISAEALRRVLDVAPWLRELARVTLAGGCAGEVETVRARGITVATLPTSSQTRERSGGESSPSQEYLDDLFDSQLR